MVDKAATIGEVKQLSWSEALLRLQENELRVRCADLVGAATESARVLKKRATVFLARYGFGSHIIRQKKFILPDGSMSDMGSLFKVVPVSLVLSRQAEVYVPSQDESDLPRSLRLLQPGDLFGVFEVANRLAGLDYQMADWWVAAGARTARLLYPLDNQDVKQYLRDEVESDICAKEAFRRGDDRLEDWTWHLMVGLSRKYAPEWYTELLVFPDCWFEGDHGLRFKCEVFKAAWKQVQIDNISALRHMAISDVAKNRDKPLYHMLCHKDIGDNDRIQLLGLLDDVASGRAIVHVPFAGEGEDGRGGPFSTIIKRIEESLAHARRDRKADNKISPIVLVPTYLVPGGSGFVSFSRPTLEIARLKCERMTDFLSAMGEKISRPQTLQELELLIPQLDWTQLCFYGQFGSPGPYCRKAKDLSFSEKRIHSSNRFFLHSAYIARRR